MSLIVYLVCTANKFQVFDNSNNKTGILVSIANSLIRHPIDPLCPPIAWPVLLILYILHIAYDLQEEEVILRVSEH